MTMASDDPRFHGRNLLIARTFRGLTQQQLGKCVFASTSSIWQLENNVREPSTDLLEALSSELGLEPRFFYSPLLDTIHDYECNFRHRKAASQRVKKRVLAHGSLAVHAIQYLRSTLDFPKYDVPAIQANTNEQIEAAADCCRNHWRLGVDAPLAHVGRVLENAGVVLIRHREDSKLIDAFSRIGPSGSVAIVVLNPLKESASRALFNMAHELGHLVLHTTGSRDRERDEQQANRFGSAFLMPRRAFSREFRMSSHVDWHHLYALKSRWRTSLAALIRRAWDLRLISAVQYRYFNKQLRIKGWHLGEPYEPEHEHPELIQLALNALHVHAGTSLSKLASELCWSPQLLADVLGVSLPEDPSRGVVDLHSHRNRRRSESPRVFRRPN